MLKRAAAIALMLALLPCAGMAEGGPTVFLGDSLTAGLELEDLFPDSGFINMGAGGDTTLGILRRLDAVIALKPDRVFLMAGVNDLSIGIPLDSILESYEGIVAGLTESGARVFVESVLPVDMDIIAHFSDYSVRNESITDLNEALMELAEKRGCAYIDLYGVFEDGGRMCQAYTIDGLHLSQEGCRRLAEEISRYLY